MTTPLHQVFRHNMRLLLENLDKNEVSLQDIDDIRTEYVDFTTQVRKLGNLVTEDMFNEFLNNNIFVEVKDKRKLDGLVLYTIMLDNFVQVTVTHNVEAQDVYVSPFIRVYDNNKFILGTGIEYLNNYYNLARTLCAKEE